MNRSNNMFRRVISLVLIFALSHSVCPVGVHAQEIAKSVPFVIDGATHYLDFRFAGDTLYCPADQWAQVANCLWKYNPDQKKVYIYDHYEDSLAIFTDFDDQEYIMDGSVPWIPFFDAAKHSGVFFSDVKNDAVYGYRARPLAVFYLDMDRVFRIPNYRISSLINSLGDWWIVASSAARSYAILSTMSIEGFIDAATGKMDQEIYDDIFIELLKTDDSLLGAFANLGEEISRPGEVISLLQKSLDEDGVLVEGLQEMGFDESEIREIVWNLAQDAYGNKTLNDLADYHEAMELTNFLDILEIIDDMTTSIDADSHTIMAMQKVFSDSNSAHIRDAVTKAIEFRLGNKALALGKYTFEYLDGVLADIVIDEIEDSFEEGWDIKSWEKLRAKILVWTYDKALSLTDKSDAIMYAEASSLIQLELVDYYYKHCNDETADTGLLMHSVALLYLRSCLASWKMFDFDKTLSGPIGNAKATILAEISNLMEYTEAELRQNGTSDECVQAIAGLVRRKPTDVKPEATAPVDTVPVATVPVEPVPEVTVPVETVSEATTPVADNSDHYGSWSDWSTTPISGSSTLEVETYNEYQYTRYFMAHYCTGNVSGAQYKTWKSNNSSNSTFNENCVYHSLGWFDSLSSFSERDETGYIGSTCSNSCWTWYIMEIEDVYITYYRSRPIG